MLSSPRVMIASAFGRGHWLAASLQRAGFNVQLIDLTARLGNTLPEDKDGPFGSFVSPRWEGLELEALNSLGAGTELPNGFIVWFKNGPLELRGATTIYRSETMKQGEWARRFVEHGSDPSVDRKIFIEKINQLPFEQRWMTSLACDLTSHHSQSPNEAFRKNIPIGLFEKFLSRTPESYDLAASLNWCRQQGVIISEKADIPDLKIEGGRVVGLEIKAERSGFVRCQQLVWMLTSMETERLEEKVFSKLFKGRLLEPEWCWMRYKIQFQMAAEAFQLPREFLLMEDVNLPWAHENFALFRKGKQPRQYHVWLRLPYSQRFHGEYLAERIQPVLASLNDRCARLRAEVLSLPLEAQGNTMDVGAPQFPIYREEYVAHPPGVSLKNVWHSHPERWSSYAWEPIFFSQKKMMAEMQRWWGDLSDEQKQKELQL